MRPRYRLTALFGTVAATLCLAWPALAQSGAEHGAVLLPAYDYVVPDESSSDTLQAKDETGSGEQQAPAPAPSGCPFRDGKLELIV
jgi:hypothetical protein